MRQAPARPIPVAPERIELRRHTVGLARIGGVVQRRAEFRTRRRAPPTRLGVVDCKHSERTAGHEARPATRRDRRRGVK